MEMLSAEHVEKIWGEAAGFSPQQAEREMIKMSKSQPDLLAFLMSMSDGLSTDARELAICIGFVVYKMFANARSTIPNISSEEIMDNYKENLFLLEDLKGSRVKIIDSIIKTQSSDQPHVMKYVIEALTEDTEGDDIKLTAKDTASLFILLKTVIEVLDEKG
ncbi:MAG: hypothetical protein AB1553_06855 [Nitrospirota bacterium]